MSTYIDTSAFLAILNKEDEQHKNASKVWIDLIDSQELIVASNYVVVETIALLQNRHGKDAVRRFLEDILSVVLLEWIDPSIHQSSVLAFLGSCGKNSPSLVDCTSIYLINSKSIENVFVYDKHFIGLGLNIIG